jgi:hypothetical protein
VFGRAKMSRLELKRGQNPRFPGTIVKLGGIRLRDCQTNESLTSKNPFDASQTMPHTKNEREGGCNSTA